MQIGSFVVLKLTRPGRGRHIVRAPFIVFRCDACNEVGSRKYSDIRSDLHFCNRACATEGRKRGMECRSRIEQTKEKNDPGATRRISRWRETMVTNHGSYKTSEIPTLLEKITTNTTIAMKNYGRVNALLGLEKKYGSGIISSWQVDEAREKAKQTCLKRYGVPFYSQTGEFKELFNDPIFVAKRLEIARTTWLKNYGVDHPMKDANVLCKSQATNISRYGVSNVAKFQLFIRKIKTTNIARYGVSCTLMRPEITNVRSMISKSEARFGRELQQYFDVVQQVHVDDWTIDFYVPSLDLYVQFDGVYWHGLNRPIEQIRQNVDSSRDCRIVKRWENDRVQDAYFKDKLVRITDEEFSRVERSGEFKELLYLKGIT